MPYAVVAILVLGSICASMGAFLLKVGATGQTELLGFVNAYLFSGLMLYGLGAVFWVYAMSSQTLISVYPFTILSFVLVYLFGIVFLGERPSSAAAIGVVFILVGLYLIAHSDATISHAHPNQKQLDRHESDYR